MIRKPYLLKKSRFSRFRLTIITIVCGAIFVSLFSLYKFHAQNSILDIQELDLKVVVQPKIDKEETIITTSQTPQKPVHFIYTVGCGGSSDTTWQLLQSTALDYSFRAVGQRGKITRLVSGCTNDNENQRLMKLSVLSELETIFVPPAETVDVVNSGKRTYVQANRPTALRQYLSTNEEVLRADPATVYVVIDPDFIFRKQVPEDDIQAVESGTFVSQAYSLVDPNRYAYTACLEAFNQTSKSDSCERIKRLRSFHNFHAGVPYMLTRKDWLSLVDYWIPLIGPVLLRYPGIESDMISWAMAASLAGLKPILRKEFMATCMSSEQASVENVLHKQVFLHLCQAYYVPETRGEQYMVNKISEIPYIVKRRPFLDGVDFVFVFNKHWLKRSNLLTDCSVPLLAMPPALPPKTTSGHHKWYQAVLEESIPAYNKAIMEFRKSVTKCDEASFDNLSGKALILHEKSSKRFPNGWNHQINV